MELPYNDEFDEDLIIKDEVKKIRFSDIITVQSILCIVIALALIILNIANNQLAKGYFDAFVSAVENESEYYSEFENRIAELFGSDNDEV